MIGEPFRLFCRGSRAGCSATFASAEKTLLREHASVLAGVSPASFAPGVII
jgi:hypothetical protein